MVGSRSAVLEQPLPSVVNVSVLPDGTLDLLTDSDVGSVSDRMLSLLEPKTHHSHHSTAPDNLKESVRINVVVGVD
jgi:hypothetical protein